MKDEKTENRDRQPYEKPGLRAIELVAEEVLGVGCKLDDGGEPAPLGTNCTDGGCAEAGT